MISKYLNPYTDFGFKKLFGEEASKDLLLDFLNQLLPPWHQIAQLSFKNTENMSDTVEQRKSVFDIYCQSASGERFIVEMQKAQMHYFKDRSLFYSSFPIREQGQKGRNRLEPQLHIPTSAPCRPSKCTGMGGRAGAGKPSRAA